MVTAVTLIRVGFAVIFAPSTKITVNPTRIRVTNFYILGLGLALGLELLAELTDPN